MAAQDHGYTLEENAALDGRNSLRVAARARRLVDIHDASRLPEVLALPEIEQDPLLILGGGSNVLFVDDYPGTVIHLDTHGVSVSEHEAHTDIAVAAGELWDDFVRWSLGQGHAGLENLVMIPGSVGAAPMQNIGAYGREVASYIESVEAWDRRRQQVTQFPAADCAFAYRDSLFKRQPDAYIITAVRFRLPKTAPLCLDYAGVNEQLRRMGVDRPTPFHVADAVVQLRTRKLPDPAIIGNAGSFFKNPQLDADAADRLLGKHAALPHWPMPDGRIKLSAAWMIDACGFKGLREGDAGISNRHALVLVNHGTATGGELWALAQQVIRAVEDRFGLTLEPEPRIISTN